MLALRTAGAPTLLVLAAMLLGPSPANGAAAYPGRYEGKAGKADATVTVYGTLDRLQGRLQAPVKTSCGRIGPSFSMGKIEDGRFSFRASEFEGAIVTSVEGQFSANGRAVTGTVRYKESNQATGDSCKAKPFDFRARLVKASVLTPFWDGGHYAGTASDGQAIGFDLAVDPRTWQGWISGLTYHIGPVTCESMNYPHTYMTIDRQPTVSGPVDESGEFEIPEGWTYGDWDVMDAAYGELRVGQGKASGTIHTPGTYGANGDPAGHEYDCNIQGGQYVDPIPELDFTATRKGG